MLFRSSVLDLAGRVKDAGARAGLKVEIDHVPNPRVELEEHYYNAKHSKLIELGLQPNLLTDAMLDGMLQTVRANCQHVQEEIIMPTIKWSQGAPGT